MNVIGHTEVHHNPDSWEGWYWGATHHWGHSLRVGQSDSYGTVEDCLQNCDMIVFWSANPEATSGAYGAFEGTVRRKWLAERLTGRALYDFAAAEAQALGWVLNMDLSGHRISEFPHEAHYGGPMAEIDFTPTGGPLWVLEIHIRHPQLPFGAFFEDMLLDDSHFTALAA